MHNHSNKDTQIDNTNEPWAGLTAAQKRFCEYYVSGEGLNATAAYQRAYPNCTYETAMSEASKSLRKPKIRSYVRYLNEQSAIAAECVTERIMAQLTKIAFSNIFDVLDIEDGRVSLRRNIPKRLQEAVKKIVVTENEFGQRVEVEMKDSLKALDKLGERLGLWDSNQTVNVNNNINLY